MVCVWAALLCDGGLLFSQQTSGTLRGVVVNRATGQPIARVMVYPSAAAAAVLTDSAGRFSFPDLPLGTVQVRYHRPGYLDPLSGQDRASRSVTLTADSPEQVLPLEAAAALHGQLMLGDGDSAAGMMVELYQAHVQDGRRNWQQAQMVRARADGNFSFLNLRPGSYAVRVRGFGGPGAAGNARRNAHRVCAGLCAEYERHRLGDGVLAATGTGGGCAFAHVAGSLLSGECAGCGGRRWGRVPGERERLYALADALLARR